MDNTAGRIRRFSRIWERLGEDVANIDKHHQLIQGIFGATGSAAVLYDGLGEGDKSRLSDLDFENLVFALTVWSIKRLSPQPVSSPHGNLPLGKVVHSCGLPYTAFFGSASIVIQRSEPVFRELFGENSVRALEQKVQATVEQFMYTSAFRHLFAKKMAFLVKGPKDVELLGWLLFLAIGARLPLQTRSDQHFVATLLICCANIVLSNMPPSFLAPSPLGCFSDGDSRDWSRDAEGRIDVLDTLCRAFRLGPDTMPAIRVLMKQVDVAASDILGPPDQPPAPSPLSPPPVSPTCAPRPGIVLLDGTCGAAIDAASGAYEELYLSHGEVDERSLWTDPGAVGDTRMMTPRKGAPCVMPKGGAAPTPFRKPAVPSSLMTPAPTRTAPVMYTPISGALRGAQWLSAVAAEEPDPLTCIPDFMKCLGKEEAQRWITTAHDIIVPVLQPVHAKPDIFQPPHVSGRPAQALKLWVRALRGMVASEPEQRRHAVLKRILSKATTMRAIVACALEMLAGAARITDLKFPNIPARLGLTPFDLFKFIKPLTLHESSMPEDVKRHMVGVLVSIVEHRAWEPRSSFFAYLCAARGQPCPVFAQPPSLSAAHNAPSHNHIMSPVQETHIDEDVPQPPLPRSFMPETAEADEGEVTSAPKEGASEAQASCRKVIEDLLRDAMRLTEERIALLLAEMPQTHFWRPGQGDTKEPVERGAVAIMAAEVVRSALRSQTHLIFNRHLDQIMMCALYSVCKVGQLREVMFKDIVMCYQRLPHGTPGVFRNVVLQQTDALLVQERNDIIKFYNRVFMPTMKPYIYHANARYSEAVEAAQVAQTQRAVQQAAQTSLQRAPDPSTSAGGTSAHPASPPGTPARPVASPAPTTPVKSPRVGLSPSVAQSPRVIVSPLRHPAGHPTSQHASGPVVHLGHSPSSAVLRSSHAFEGPETGLSAATRNMAMGHPSEAAPMPEQPPRKKHRLGM